MSFRKRLNFVLADRTLTGWGRDNKLSGGTISRISSNKIPGHQILNFIQQIENVSLGWLVDGVGRPFMVHDEFSDKETAAYLCTLLEESGWRIDFITDEQDMAMVCTLPAEIQFKDKVISYTVVEVICGRYGAATQAALADFDNIYWQQVSPEQLASLCHGELGSYKLVGDAHSDGLLAASKPLDRAPQAMAGADTEIDESIDALAKRFARLNKRNQQAVKMIMDALLASQASTS